MINVLNLKNLKYNTFSMRKIWFLYKVAMAIWINIYGCQLYPKHAHLSANQLKNDSYC